jgi:acyl-CoA reductase-like NAD-dependent aldehyde dehydrogenase
MAVGALQTKLLIDGAWVRAVSGRDFATLNPATEDTIAEIAEAGRADIDLAVASARRALTKASGRP